MYGFSDTLHGTQNVGNLCSVKRNEMVQKNVMKRRHVPHQQSDHLRQILPQLDLCICLEPDPTKQLAYQPQYELQKVQK